jgi:TrpR-related protein YerC/YecD
MTRISRRPLDKERLNRFYDDFWAAVALLDNKQEARNFFSDLLTHTERKMLAKRLQIALMLLQQENYHQIKHYVGVSDSTIAKINNWLNTGATGLSKIGERLAKIRSAKQKEDFAFRPPRLASDLLTPAISKGLELTAQYLHRKQKQAIND